MKLYGVYLTNAAYNDLFYFVNVDVPDLPT